jgi:mono/diheme cytochrome c family protein
MKSILLLLIITLMLLINSSDVMANNQERGRWLYAKYCDSCHEQDGSGTPYGKGLDFPVRDLRTSYLLSQEDMRFFIRYGLFERELLDKGKGLKADDIDDLISYIRSFSYTPNSIRGRRLYRRLCAICHGRRGHGDTNFATPDLRRGSLTDVDMAKMIRYGRHDTKMIGKKDRLGNTDIADIISYLLSIRVNIQ